MEDDEESDEEILNREMQECLNVLENFNILTRSSNSLSSDLYANSILQKLHHTINFSVPHKLDLQIISELGKMKLSAPSNSIRIAILKDYNNRT